MLSLLHDLFSMLKGEFNYWVFLAKGLSNTKQYEMCTC